MTGGSESKINIPIESKINIPTGPMMKPMNAPINPGKAPRRSLFARLPAQLRPRGSSEMNKKMKKNHAAAVTKYALNKQTYNSPEQQIIRTNYEEYLKRYTKKNNTSSTQAGNKNMTNLDYLSSVLNLNLGPNTASGPVTTQKQYGTGPNTVTVISTSF
jgi:hypothetical protein